MTHAQTTARPGPVDVILLGAGAIGCELIVQIGWGSVVSPLRICGLIDSSGYLFDQNGLSRRHLLVVTDGENTDGFDPELVTAAINRRPEAERPSLYFVAFDIEAKRFARVRDAGALLLGASDATELNSTLDSLLRGQILIER